MRVFIGSSREQLDVARLVGTWLEDRSMKPLLWDAPDVFAPGQYTGLTLLEISRSVDAAIFIFGEDDETWYRGDAMKKARDNVVLEYGIFAGALGFPKTLIFKSGSPSIASDLEGLTRLDYKPERENDARLRFGAWVNNLDSKQIDPVLIEKDMLIASQKRELERLRRDREFDQSSINELLEKISENRSGDVIEELYLRENYYKMANGIRTLWPTSDLMKQGLIDAGLKEVSDMINWEDSTNPQRAGWFSQKILGAIRVGGKNQDWQRIGIFLDKVRS